MNEEIIRKTIEELDKKTLRDKVVAQALKDATFRNAILSAPEKHTTPDKKSSIRAIKKSIRAYSREYGYVERRNAMHAMDTAIDILEEAGEDREQGDFKSAFIKIQALLESLYPAIQEIDDSDGEVGDVIDSTWEEFRKLVDTLPESMKKEVYDFCLASAKSDIYSGWGVEVDFYEIASKVIVNEGMKNRLMEKLNDLLATKDYGLSRIIEVQVRILEKSGETQAVKELLQNNIHIPEIRNRFIEETLHNKDYDGAKKLAEV